MKALHLNVCFEKEYTSPSEEYVFSEARRIK
jgi:hypothetical protein